MSREFGSAEKEKKKKEEMLAERKEDETVNTSTRSYVSASMKIGVFFSIKKT